MTERITGVAVISNDGRMWALPEPHRHHHLFALAALIGSAPDNFKQGFVTASGRFVDRREGFTIAKAAGQVNRRGGYNGSDLFSEDMW